MASFFLKAQPDMPSRTLGKFAQIRVTLDKRDDGSNYASIITMLLCRKVSGMAPGVLWLRAFF